jgi:colanic acid biosynthesis glycosyl transferase WcaI
MLAKAMRAFNAFMFRGLDAVVIIGRDTEKLLLRYGGMTTNRFTSFRTGRRLLPAFAQ